MNRFCLSIFLLVGTAAACASVADLEVTYGGNGAAGDQDAASDPDAARQKVRESQVEASAPMLPDPIEDGGGGLPCFAEAGLSGEEDGGCDESVGNGCCLRSASSVCMSQAEARAQQCGSPSAKAVFVACRQSRSDDMCCWRDLGAGGGRAAFYSGSCDGGTIACIDDSGCVPFGLTCATTSCAPSGFVIGQCGATAPPCPGAL